jgi:hypothetical protein
MHFTYIYTVYINNRSYDWDALQKHSVKTGVDCICFMAHKNIPHTEKHKGLND